MARSDASGRSVETMTVPQGTYDLARPGDRARSPLRAWDAADELLLHHVAESPDVDSTLVVNDGFGALAVALADGSPQLVADSHLAHRAIEENVERNALGRPALHTSFDPWPPAVDRVIVKIPRSRGQLEDQLHRLRDSLGPQTEIVGAAMAKHIHNSTIELFETICGPATTSLARKKARLILCRPDPSLPVPENPWPARWVEHGLNLVGHGGVFSAERVDRGTAVLLGCLAPDASVRHVLDLGSGTGVLGLRCAALLPEATVAFVDDSYRAIESSRESWWANFADRPARFDASDRAVNVIERGSVDLVVCNPPFHTDRARGDQVAWNMLVDSYSLLRPGGELWMVGNRHLGYHAKVRKIFGNADVSTSDPKFVVLRATR